MKKNLLIGAISGNYSVSDISTWVETSNFEDVHRTLLIYNLGDNPELIDYLKLHNIECVVPDVDYWGNKIDRFETNTGAMTLESSYNLIHNIRFYHIWLYLKENQFDRILITDVRDVYFNRDPFYNINEDDITATSEEIIYQNETWNREHLLYNLGQIGYDELKNTHVYNVGVFGGGYELIKDMCRDIYIMSVGKIRVADQTSFNYLLSTKYYCEMAHSDLSDHFTVHLHVINAGLVEFDLKDISKYAIVHQYDRIPNFKR